MKTFEVMLLALKTFFLRYPYIIESTNSMMVLTGGSLCIVLCNGIADIVTLESIMLYNSIRTKQSETLLFMWL